MDSDDIAVGFMLLLFIAGMFGFVYFLTTTSEAKTDEKCKQQFGQEWIGKYVHYGTNFCVNKNGEVKVPQ